MSPPAGQLRLQDSTQFPKRQASQPSALIQPTIAIAAIPSQPSANSDVLGSCASDNFSVVSSWLTASPCLVARCSLVSVHC